MACFRRTKWLRFAMAAALSLGAGVYAEQLTVYYDYVEDGQLKGGKIMIDPANPQHRATFGLDGGFTADDWVVTTIIDNGPTTNRIDLVVVGDGYTESELDDYANHVDDVLASFFAEEPLAGYASYFNVHRVDVVSNESGVDEPDEGIYRNTALDMAYNCSGIPRLLCIKI